MQKQQVFYIHGGSSYSVYEDYLENLRHKKFWNAPDSEGQKKWPATLRMKLGDEYQVFTPTMPNSDNARYEEWKIWFERHFEFLVDGVILLGWSQGGYFLAKYLIENEPPVRIKALFLVAAPFESADFGGEDGGDFTFDISKTGELTKKAEKIYIMHSEDDPVVPYEHALKYKEALPDAELVTFTDKNHFLSAEFPELLDLLTKL